MPSPANDPAPGLLRRCALGLWFCGIAAIGGIEFHRAAFAGTASAPALVAWLWLAGTCGCLLAGVVLLLREWRRSGRASRAK
jgi:hypothetical protein